VPAAKAKIASTQPPSPSNPEGATPESRWRSLVSDSDAWMLAAAIVIGALAALANVVFHSAIEGFHDFFWGDIGGSLGIGARPVDYDIWAVGLDGLTANWWLIPLVPMLGMSLIMVLDRWFPGEMKGYGLPNFLEIVNVQGGYIRRRWITLKTLSASINLGCGMSCGVEGPVAQIGGSVGSTVGRALRPKQSRLRVLIACGSAAAICATFGSPIAGVMFATEVVLIGASQLQSLSLLVVATGAASVVSQYVAGEHRFIHAPHFTFPVNHELMFYVLMGLLSGLLAVFYIRSFYALADWASQSRVPARVQPLLAGLVVGSCLIAFPQIGGGGYDAINAAFAGELSASLLLSLALMKILMTGVTLGFGGAGGVFAPSMFIGACFGGGFAAVIHHFLPGAITDPGSFALIGMGSFLAAATHAPMTAIFLLFEITRDYGVVLPIMISAISATLLARRIFPDSIDHYALSRRGVDLHAGTESNLLKNLYVRGLVQRDVQPIPAGMTLTDFCNYVTNSHHTHFPVIDDEDALCGVISVQDLRSVLMERDSWPYLVVSELATLEVPKVTPSSNLFEAMEALAARGLEQIPVVDESDSTKIVGMLRGSDLQNFYQKRLLAHEVDH
jgi:CIC family chloride channel protein